MDGATSGATQSVVNLCNHITLTVAVIFWNAGESWITLDAISAVPRPRAAHTFVYVHQ